MPPTASGRRSFEIPKKNLLALMSEVPKIKKIAGLLNVGFSEHRFAIANR